MISYPSVTTILSQTQSEEKKKSLADWRAKMGPEAADKVKDVAATRVQPCTGI